MSRHTILLASGLHSSKSASSTVADRPPQLLTPQQQRFFETFGFLKLEGLLRDDIDWVRHEFEAVWEAVGWVHDGSSRSFYNVDIATGEPAPYCHVSRHSYRWHLGCILLTMAAIFVADRPSSGRRRSRARSSGSWSR